MACRSRNAKRRGPSSVSRHRKGPASEIRTNPPSLPGPALKNVRLGKKLRKLVLDLSGPVQSLDELSPPFGGGDKLVLPGKGVLCLQARALQNEIGQANAPALRPCANQLFLASCRAKVDASAFRCPGIRLSHTSPRFADVRTLYATPASLVNLRRRLIPSLSGSIALRLIKCSHSHSCLGTSSSSSSSSESSSRGAAPPASANSSPSPPSPPPTVSTSTPPLSPSNGWPPSSSPGVASPADSPPPTSRSAPGPQNRTPNPISSTSSSPRCFSLAGSAPRNSSPSAACANFPPTDAASSSKWPPRSSRKSVSNVLPSPRCAPPSPSAKSSSIGVSLSPLSSK